MDYIRNILNIKKYTQENKKKTRPKHHFKNNTRKKITIKKMNCSPLVENKTVLSETCFTSEILMQIRDNYNKNHPNNKKITSDNPVTVWETLKERLTACDKEDCWLKEIKDTKLRKDIDDYIFAPDHPPDWNKNPNEWLSNIDILKVLKQYEQKNKNFLFLGPTPIDFDTKLPERGYSCVESQICNLSIKEQKKAGKNKIGIVFNLDKHNESGSHWVSLFIDLEKRIIFYFDSAGDSIPREILVLKERIIKQGKEMEPPILFKYYDSKNIRHQQGNTECGMYSLFFLITMLTGKTEFKNNMTMKEKIHLFKSGRIPDKFVEKYRKKYFNDL
jgi:hypothetical protein